MTELIFNDADEARAWDMYVAAMMGASRADMGYQAARDALAHNADAMILERRKRMAPEKVDREWIPHKPGDPMPCDANANIKVKIRYGTTLYGSAYCFSWSEIKSNPSGEIMAWGPA